MYIDGVQKGSVHSVDAVSPQNLDAGANGVIWMGKRDSAIWTQPNKAVNGGLDQVMILKRALPAQEIQN